MMRKGHHSEINPAVIAAATLLLLVLVYLARPGITGNAAASFHFTISGFTFQHACAIQLENGWNLISVPCTAANTSISSVLSGTATYSSVHSYYANDSQDPWKSYKPGLPSWVVQDLTNINETKAYWIRMQNQAWLNVTGTITLPYDVRLLQGWNLVGFPTNVSGTPESLFASINSSITAVHSYNASDTADSWKAYFPTLSNSTNDLTLIAPYRGYWINATGQATWQIPLG